MRDRLDRASSALGQVADLLPGLVDAADGAFLASLGGAERQAITDAALVPRSEVARAILTRSGPDRAPPLLDRLRAKYDVTLMRFGKSGVEVPSLDFSADPSADEFSLRTDMTAAFEEIVERVPAESLAGVLMLSDGRHNGNRPPDDVARALGIQGSPVRAVGVGSAIGPKDAAFLKIESPESIYLGDRIKVRAEVKADGMKGRQLKVTLSREGEVVDTQTIPVPEDSHRTSVKLGHAPPEKGIFEYTVRIEPQDGELFADNNEWKFETAVTDDRTDVLLVDGYPRWEFRYLRNLFYGRDKSVHLQYVLLNPDSIEGQDPLPAVAASARRSFGEAEATRLPDAPDEWLKFDVIIVGDVGPGVWSSDTWEIVERCVAERGALLVVIAGSRAMPHAHRGETVRKLLPVEFPASQGADFNSPDPGFFLRLTGEGRNSPIMRQSDSAIESGQVWAALPALMWRHPVSGSRPVLKCWRSRRRKGSARLRWGRLPRNACRRSRGSGVRRRRAR